MIVEVLYQFKWGGISGTLDSSYYKGQGERQGIEREYIVEIFDIEVMDVISESHRAIDGEQSSRELLRTGCI